SYLVAVSVDFTDALRDKVADRCGVHGRVLLTHRRDCRVLAPRVEKPRPSVSIPPLAAGRAWTRTFLLAREPPAAGLRRHTAPRGFPCQARSRPVNSSRWHADCLDQAVSVATVSRRGDVLVVGTVRRGGRRRCYPRRAAVG